MEWLPKCLLPQKGEAKTPQKNEGWG